ncbi:hypothetical protein L6R29_13600 [Myxococcota bacterium]|nr:hypothetical protein [Myxococcota bacterium]
MDAAKEKLLNVRKEAQDYERILILWDEFGRHLEYTAQQGNSFAINDLQFFAEYVSRSKDIPIVFALLLHQQMSQYGANLPQQALKEWKKVEGRFSTLLYVDQSRELYQLIVRLLKDRKEETGKRLEIPEKVDWANVARKSKELGLYSDFTEEELVPLFEGAWPLDSGALYLLPLVAARVAQNERTIFNFLYQISLNKVTSAADLYDFFSASMQMDVGVGGTHRQWLETQSALSKIENEAVAVEVLKSACLLSLGLAGERKKTSRALLQHVAQGPHEALLIEKTVEDLLERKLLLHRKHNDAVSVWHGTDANLREKLQEEVQKRKNMFQLVPFLNKEFPPKDWRPLRYNDEKAIRRYFLGRYLTLGDLANPMALQLQSNEKADGNIFYILAENEQELKMATDLLFQYERIGKQQQIFVLPKEKTPFLSYALETYCLLQLQKDHDLLATDPLVSKEIQHMLEDAQGQLHLSLQNLQSPDLQKTRYFSKGQEQKVSNSAAFRELLSQIAYALYPKTPKFDNELIVKHRPTQPVVNARKKVILGLLERYGQPFVGLESKTSADAFLFRTLFLRSGLYRPSLASGEREEKESWRLVYPEELDNRELREVWELFYEFVARPSTQAKSIESFLRQLESPPYGLRQGILPLLFAASLKAFPATYSIRRSNGEYLEDLLPTHIEDICKEPENYQFFSYSFPDIEKRYLTQAYKLFQQEELSWSDADVLRRCYDAMIQWKSEQSPGAFQSKNVSERTQHLQKALRVFQDPYNFFFRILPSIYLKGGNEDSPLSRLVEKNLNLIVQELAVDLYEISEIKELYYQSAEKSIRVALRSLDQRESLQSVTARWSSAFPLALDQQLNAMQRGFLTRLKMPYETSHLLLDSVASLLVGRSPDKWDDAQEANFDKQVIAFVSDIEASMLSLPPQALAQHGAALHSLVEQRIFDLFDKFCILNTGTSPREALGCLVDRYESQRSKADGDDERSA